MTELFTQMNNAQADFTLTFRRIYEYAAHGDPTALSATLRDKPAAIAWIEHYQDAFTRNVTPREERLGAMKKANPLFIPRNHRIEEVISAALQGDEAPFVRLLNVLQRPGEEQEDALDLAEPPGEEQWTYRTFCGT